MTLNEILKQHEIWPDSEGKKGEKANLEGANIHGAYKPEGFKGYKIDA